MYLQTLGKPQAIKGGVFLEGVISRFINPLPYIGNNYYSKYVQSLLYKGCLDDSNKPNLCNVKTTDNRNFTVTLSGSNSRSDGSSITLNDIYFTYKDIIQENALNLSFPVPNNLESITKNEDHISVVFKDASINNLEFFKNYILPSEILKDRTKDYYTSEYLNRFVNSTCIKFNSKSDFKNNIILDYKNCPDYYINSYQFVLLNDIAELSRFLTGTNRIDMYGSYENIDPNTFNQVDVIKKLRYGFFWNTNRQTNTDIKSFLSHKILSGLKENVNISSRLNFNGYGLFLLPESKLSSGDLNKLLSKNVLAEEKKKFEDSFGRLNGNVLNYIYGSNNKFYIPSSLDKNIVIVGNIGQGGYTRLGISQNGHPEYFPQSYNGKTFKYVLSSDFKNINKGKNTYTIYVYNSAGVRKKLDEIIVYYQTLDYPDFQVGSEIEDFILLYLNDGLIAELGNSIANILEKNYPGKLVVKKVQQTEYQEILKSGNYDMVVGNVNFDGNDISSLFKTKDPMSNPSLFVSQSFASLISQNLLVSLNQKADLFKTLNKIYQDFIPIVFIGNEKISLFINKRYKIDKELDYSYFVNRENMLKSIIINKINKPVRNKVSFYSFYEFLKDGIKNN